MESKPYNKTQYGWLGIIALFGFLAFLALAYYYQWGNNPMTTVVFGFSILFFSTMIALFYMLRVSINEDTIHIIYGVGLIHIRIKPQEIKSIEIVTNPWYYGLGIKIIPKGMLYNIQGKHAIEMTYSNEKGKEKIVRIGSAKPHLLKEAILSAFN